MPDIYITVYGVGGSATPGNAIINGNAMEADGNATVGWYTEVTPAMDAADTNTAIIAAAVDAFDAQLSITVGPGDKKLLLAGAQQ